MAALAEGHKTKCHVVFVHQGVLFGRSLIFIAYSTSTNPALAGVVIPLKRSRPTDTGPSPPRAIPFAPPGKPPGIAIFPPFIFCKMSKAAQTG